MVGVQGGEGQGEGISECRGAGMWAIDQDDPIQIRLEETIKVVKPFDMNAGDEHGCRVPVPARPGAPTASDRVVSLCRIGRMAGAA